MPTIPAAYRSLIVLASCVLVVCSLYFARVILAPMALALLLTFLLSPAVNALQRRGLGTTLPAVLVTTMAMAVVAGLGFLLWVQAESVVEGLPRYEDNIRQKLAVLREAQTGPFSPEAQRTLEQLAGELAPEQEGEQPLAVTVVPGRLLFVSQLSALAGPLAMTGLVIVLVFFMLLQRRPLRDRMIYLFGRRNLTVTTKALDEAAQTISGYLLAQAVVHVVFALGVMAGLMLIGVPYALLWAVIAALLRYIPYLGPWMAAALPFLLSVAISQGWTQPVLVLALFLVLELLSNLLLEPIVYGRAAGVSPVALIVSIAVWTLLWGPVGLFLATPLTVCLVVLSRHVPQLRFLAFLMGNEPVAARDVIYYQRLLARDEDEAVQIATEFARANQDERTCEELLLPALASLKADREREGITDDELRFGLHATRQVLEALQAPPGSNGAAAERRLLLACAASDDGDLVALQLLQRLLGADHVELRLLGPDVLVSEVVEEIARLQPAAVCIGSLAPGGLSRALLLCKRLAALAPRPRVVVGRWASAQFERDEAALREAGADRVAPTLLETRRELQSQSLLDAPA
jgi:predicted PurR-regulated permease PerM